MLPLLYSTDSGKALPSGKINAVKTTTIKITLLWPQFMQKPV